MSVRVHLELQQLPVGCTRQAIWHKEIGQEEQADACCCQPHREGVEGQEGGVRYSAKSGQQGEHVSREEPHLSGLHEEGTQCTENNLTCRKTWECNLK